MNKTMIFGATGPSVFSEDIQLMVENYFNATHLYINHNDKEDLDWILNNIDALVLAGGSDIFPGTVGRPVTHGNSLSKFDIARDKREIYLINKCLEKKIPILAICRGFQLISSIFGFNLIQDLDGNVCHSPGEIKVNIDAGEFMHFVECLNIYKKKYFSDNEPCNSYHHQGVYFQPDKISSKGLCAVAVADTYSYKHKDSYQIIEIAENKDNKIVGCQFHCERDYKLGNKASLSVLENFKKLL